MDKHVGTGLVPVLNGAEHVGTGLVPVLNGAEYVGTGLVPVLNGAEYVGTGLVPVLNGAEYVGTGLVPVLNGAEPVGTGLVPALNGAMADRLNETPGTLIQVEGHIREGQNFGERREVRVTVLRGGASANGFYYGPDALQAVTRLVEGAQAYLDHSTAACRSVRDIAGFYRDALYLPPAAGEQHGHVEATLHILESADWLWTLIKEAVALGRPELIGLSIDIFGTLQAMSEARGGRRLQEVTNVLALNSCDIVTRPSAGGVFQHILHGTEAGQQADFLYHTNTGGAMEQDIENVGIDLARPTPAQNIAPTPREATELMATAAETPAEGAAQRVSEEIGRNSEELLRELRLERAQLLLERRLAESVLPEAVRGVVRQKFAGRIFEAAELDRELTLNQQMLADLTRAGLVRDHGYERVEMGAQITEAEKIQAAFDLMFDKNGDMLSDADRTRLGPVRGFQSIREAYARVTGDASVAAISDRSLLGNIRVSEHAPLQRITEADTTTATFTYLLGTSMNKRLLRDYQTWAAEWMKFCTIVPIRDFKQQTRVRMGAFGSLPIVPEDSAYTSVSLQDSAATYVPQKRGNLVTVSRETIVNDDLNAIRTIPTKLAAAAAYTLAEFVYAFLSGNPTVYDGSALFTSGAPHSNLGASALSTSSMQAGVTAMREQTNFAGKRIGLRPKFLVVPPELEFSAMVMTKSAGVPGSPNNDINPMLGYVTPIVSPQLTNASQWFMAADPQVVDTIEIGFVGGQVNPVLLIQDQPLYGLNFSQDVVSYKCRQEYGGCVVDYRGLYRGV